MTRIFLKEKLELNKEIKVADKLHHYLINVMRSTINDDVTLINGIDGEFLSKIHVSFVFSMPRGVIQAFGSTLKYCARFSPDAFPYNVLSQVTVTSPFMYAV